MVFPKVDYEQIGRRHKGMKKFPGGNELVTYYFSRKMKRVIELLFGSLLSALFFQINFSDNSFRKTTRCQTGSRLGYVGPDPSPGYQHTTKVAASKLIVKCKC